jgi:pyridoxamine 5'-phosphate oxidase
MIAAMARHGDDPIAKFIRWLEDARRARIPNYEAMALATAARGGKSSVRFVLLKGVDQRGFMFFTDARSRKGGELRGNPHGSLALYWQPKGRQVRVEGRVEEISPAEADAYWATRPRQSQLAASASHQSARLRSRAELLARFARLARKFRGAKFRARRSGPGFVCVLMRSNSGPTANIAYTTVRSIFDMVAAGDVICSSLRRPHTTGAFPRLLWAATHIARFRGGQPSFSGTADLGRPLSVSQVEKGSEISPFPHSTSGTESSNLSRSANQSPHLPTFLEWAENSREMRGSFWPQRTGESHLTPNSLDPASILSVRNNNGSLQRPGMRSGRCSVRHRHSGAANRSRIEVRTGIAV